MVLDLNDTVAGMLKMLQRLIGEDIDLDWRPGQTLWPVKMDPSQIDQILANLCVNARDAISGVGKITIETGNSDRRRRRTAPTTRVSSPATTCAGRAATTAAAWTRKRMTTSFEPFFTTKGVRQGHRPGAGHGVRHRQAEQRLHQRLQRAGQGNDLHDLSAPACGQGERA